MTKDELIKVNQELIKRNEELAGHLGRCERELIGTCGKNEDLKKKMIDMNLKFYGSKARII